MKFIILLLLSITLSIFHVMAEDRAVTLKIQPSVKAQGTLQLEGNEQLKGNTVNTGPEAEGQLRMEADYSGMAGMVVEFQGDFNRTQENMTNIGFGDHAYAYGHILKAFAVDPKKWGLYLQAGLFELELDNAQSLGRTDDKEWDDWLAYLEPLGRDEHINIQLDFAIMNLLTLRYGQSFQMIEGNDLGYDFGFSLLFYKQFGPHKVRATLGYLLDAAGNEDLQIKQPKDFDQLGATFTYTHSFDAQERLQLMPFANLRLSGLFPKPKMAYKYTAFAWSVGLKFRYLTPNGRHDLIAAAVALDGETRHNYDIEIATLNFNRQTPQPLRGVQIKAWSDVMQTFMGERFLSLWGRMRLEFWAPEKFNGRDVNRESILTKWGFGASQYLVNKPEAKLSVFAEFHAENIAPFHIDGQGYYGADFVRAQSTDMAFSLDLGLEGSFAGTWQLSLD